MTSKGCAPWMARRVPVFCPETGEFYKSMNKAALATNVAPCTISLICSGKLKGAKGLTFRAASDAEIERFNEGKDACQRLDA